MEYKIDDLKNIAILFSGLGNVDLPENIRIDETALYEYCYDMGWKTTILDDNNYCVEIFYDFLCQLADEENLADFIDYYFNKYIENRVADLTVAGYSIFQLKCNQFHLSHLCIQVQFLLVDVALILLVQILFIPDVYSNYIFLLIFKIK